MKIEETHVVTVKLFGELVAGEACERFRETFERLADSGHDEAILDFAEILYVDSTGIDEIVRLYTNLRRDQCFPRIQNPSKGVQAALKKELWGGCDCFGSDENEQDVSFHTALQDTECDGWKKLTDIVEEAAEDGREDFTPLAEIDRAEWRKIITLPPSIGKLKAVKLLCLYGSHLVRIPREIGGMSNLQTFDPYTSARLHWMPYEITRCKNLVSSRVSTRSLYGNFKNRPGFPRLPTTAEEVEALADVNVRPNSFVQCSVCDARCETPLRFQYWLSFGVATDVLPLLVNACSQECVDTLPTPPGPARGSTGSTSEYIPRLHQGGPDLEQPLTRYWG